MPSKLFVAAMLEQGEATQLMERTWMHILSALPDGTPDVERKPPHLTIRFLGEMEPHTPATTRATEALDENLRQILHDMEPITLTLQSLHTFPGTVWFGLQTQLNQQGVMQRLSAAVDDAVDECFIDHETKPETRGRQFVPHLTIGKFHPDTTSLVETLAREIQHEQHVTFTLDNIRTMHSEKHINTFTVYEPARQVKPASLQSADRQPQRQDRHPQSAEAQLKP